MTGFIYQLCRVCRATIVLVGEVPVRIVPPLPVLVQPGHSRVPQPRVVLVLVEFALYEVQGKLLTCALKYSLVSQ